MRLVVLVNILAFTAAMFLGDVSGEILGDDESIEESEIPMGNINDIFEAWNVDLSFLEDNEKVENGAPVPELPNWEPEASPPFQRKKRQSGWKKDLK